MNREILDGLKDQKKKIGGESAEIQSEGWRITPSEGDSGLN